jgi:hypothetical protein
MGEQEEPRPAAEGQLSEEELRARLDESLRKVRVQDLLLESVASIINLTARRIAKDDERDLGQAKVGIEAVRALSGLLEAEPQGQVRNALSEIQMLYARYASGGAEGEPAGAGDPTRQAGGAEPAGPAEQSQPGAGEGGTRKPPPGLWVPPGSS